MEQISVIMPTYNAEAWVCDTIDNLSRQTYPNFELIVVDDGSRDETVSRVKKKLSADFHRPWKVLELGANCGPSAARNEGLRAASGEWVQFLDSDDYMAPSKFEAQVTWCQTAPDDVAGVHSTWQLCYLNEGKVTLIGSPVVPREHINAPIMCLFGANRPLHSAGITRRSILNEIGGFNESLRFWECEELNARIAARGRLLRVPATEPAYLWRMHRKTGYVGGDEARYKLAPVALGWIEQALAATNGKPINELGLSDSENREIRDECTLWARRLYSRDQKSLREYLSMVRRLDPDFAPSHPRYASILSRYVGIEGAEAIVSLLGRPKAFVRDTLDRLSLYRKEPAFDWFG
jgi:glycosyltransferase involved in cell wall biosynthesis